MHILHRLLGLYVAGVAAVVAVSLLATLIWSNGAGSPIWVPVDWLQAAAIIIVLVVNTLRKRALDTNGADGSITRAYLEVNLLFYVSIVVTVWFFWNWLVRRLLPGQRAGRRRPRHAHADVAVYQRAGHPAPGRHRLPPLAQSRRLSRRCSTPLSAHSMHQPGLPS